jgi:hypothetical protein
VPDAAATITGALRAADSGFTLHAATTARRDDLAGKQALVRYVLRPPLAQDRVRLLDDGMVRIALKRPFSDGTRQSTWTRCRCSAAWQPRCRAPGFTP